MIYGKNIKTFHTFLLIILLSISVNAVEMPTVTGEAMTGDSDDEKYNGGCVKLGMQFYNDYYAQVEVFGGDLVDELFLETGIGIFRRTEKGHIGINYDHKDFSVFTTDQYTLDWERFMESLFTAAGVIGYDERNLADNRMFAGFMLRIYPIPDLMVESGLTYIYDFDIDFNLSGVDIRIASDYQPVIFGFKSASVFYEERFDDMRLVGIRYYFGKSKALFRRHREGNVLRIRG